MNECVERDEVCSVISSIAREKFDLSDSFGAYLKALLDVDDAVSRIPAADVAPVRSGRWVMKDKHIYQCSRCGNYLDIRGLNGGRGDANYCPNCGAAMSREAGE